MTLFVATIVGDFGNISWLLLLLLSLTTCGCGWSGISSSCGVRPFASSLAALLLFFFPGLLRRLLGLGNWFDRVGLILGLRGLRLIVPRIETHIQGLFPLGAPVIKVVTPLDLSPGFSLIACSD